MRNGGSWAWGLGRGAGLGAGGAWNWVGGVWYLVLISSVWYLVLVFGGWYLVWGIVGFRGVCGWENGCVVVGCWENGDGDGEGCCECGVGMFLLCCERRQSWVCGEQCVERWY